MRIIASRLALAEAMGGMRAAAGFAEV